MIDSWNKYKSVGLLAAALGIAIQIVAGIQQTHPSVDVRWAIISVVFIYPAGVSLVEGRVGWSRQRDLRVGLFLLTAGVVAAVVLLFFWSYFQAVFMPRIMIAGFLWINSLAVVLAGLQFRRASKF